MSAANDEPLAGDAAQGFREHTQSDVEIVPQNTSNSKVDSLTRLTAIGALNGLCVFELSGGSLLVTRAGSMARNLPDTRALAVFFAQIGVQA